MGPLPTLCEKFVELVGILVSYSLHLQFVRILFLITNGNQIVFQKDADAERRSRVVLLLQDMLEVVTRDMMVNEIR